MLYDDSRGVGEPLNETGRSGEGLIITGVHVAILDNVVNSTLYHRIIGEQCHNILNVFDGEIWSFNATGVVPGDEGVGGGGAGTGS